ncbi:hypothetical protein N657DRAFT_109679 [Parathielavia appendiculata]|uniref:Uncharacterized protein n=1 Tax=Parathielavia appendiculata TaxID=2587402 RepID=A0AAN6TWS8_9PEZI|nr:hypothetical protein N657DRAFT_109679 [Parathielavia appendiculata]
MLWSLRRGHHQPTPGTRAPPKLHGASSPHLYPICQTYGDVVSGHQVAIQRINDSPSRHRGAWPRRSALVGALLVDSRRSTARALATHNGGVNKYYFAGLPTTLTPQAELVVNDSAAAADGLRVLASWWAASGGQSQRRRTQGGSIHSGSQWSCTAI